MEDVEAAGVGWVPLGVQWREEATRFGRPTAVEVVHAALVESLRASLQFEFGYWLMVTIMVMVIVFIIIVVVAVVIVIVVIIIIINVVVVIVFL